MKRALSLMLMFTALTLGAYAAKSTVSLWPSAGEAAAYGINIPFTASARTGRYRFTVYDGDYLPGKAALVSYGEARLTPGAQSNVYLPLAYDPATPHSYTLRVQALTEPGREGLDIPGEQVKAFTTGDVPVCGSGPAHAVSAGGFLAGDGTAASPYLVTSPAQLGHVRAHPDFSFLQLRDFDLQGQNFAPIEGFTGVYDGGGYVLQNLTIHSPLEMVGLFSNPISASFQNLGIENYSITSTYGYGSRVGPLAAGMNSVYVSRCYADTGTLATGGDAGGLLGYCGGTIEDCYAVNGVLDSGVSAYPMGVRAGGISTRATGESNSLSRCFAIPAQLRGGAPGPGKPTHGTGGLLAYAGDSAVSWADCYWMTGRGASYAVGNPLSNPAGTTALSSLSDFNSFETMKGFDPAVWRVGENHLVLRVFDH